VKIRRLMSVSAIAVGLVMAFATPASAHDINLYHGSDYGWIETHDTAYVWDEECDGNTVFVQYRYSTIGGIVTSSVYDNNGCNNTGNVRSTYPQRMTSARICETNVGCSAWRSVT
jgi:hypothetical protein